MKKMPLTVHVNCRGNNDERDDDNRADQRHAHLVTALQVRRKTPRAARHTSQIHLTNRSCVKTGLNCSRYNRSCVPSHPTFFFFYSSNFYSPHRVYKTRQSSRKTTKLLTIIAQGLLKRASNLEESTDAEYFRPPVVLRHLCPRSMQELDRQLRLIPSDCNFPG